VTWEKQLGNGALDYLVVYAAIIRYLAANLKPSGETMLPGNETKIIAQPRRSATAPTLLSCSFIAQHGFAVIHVRPILQTMCISF
jgi:hypothetical protein